MCCPVDKRKSVDLVQPFAQGAALTGLLVLLFFRFLPMLCPDGTMNYGSAKIFITKPKQSE
jgi:hypothetical protein